MNEIANVEKLLTTLRNKEKDINEQFRLTVKGKGKADLYNLSRRKTDLQLQITSAKAKQLRLVIDDLENQRVLAKEELAKLEAPILAARDKWQEIRSAEMDAYVAHQSLEAHAWTLEQKSQQLFEDIAEAKRNLGQLVAQFVPDDHTQKF